MTRLGRSPRHLFPLFFSLSLHLLSHFSSFPSCRRNAFCLLFKNTGNYTTPAGARYIAAGAVSSLTPGGRGGACVQHLFPLPRGRSGRTREGEACVLPPTGCKTAGNHSKRMEVLALVEERSSGQVVGLLAFPIRRKRLWHRGF